MCLRCKYEIPFLNLRIKLYLSFNSVEKYCLDFFFFFGEKKVDYIFFKTITFVVFENWLDLSSIFTRESISVLFSKTKDLEVIYRENKYRIVDENGSKSVLKMEFHFAKHQNNLNHGLVKKVKCLNRWFIYEIYVNNFSILLPSFND